MTVHCVALPVSTSIFKLLFVCACSAPQPALAAAARDCYESATALDLSFKPDFEAGWRSECGFRTPASWEYDCRTMRIDRYCTVLLLLGCLLHAQQDTGMITGQVMDATGSAIPSARVLLVNTGTNVQTSVLTNSDGLFVAAPLRIGYIP